MNTDETTYADHSPTDITTAYDAARWLMENTNIVTDYANEYGEPGYEVTKGGFIVFGNYWCHGPRDLASCEHPAEGSSILHGAEVHYARLWKLMEDEGVEFEWYDEWYVDYNNGGKAYRTTGNSYSWEPSIMWGENDSEPLTPDDDAILWTDEVQNNPRKCLPSWFDDTKLAELGYVERECGYESGWYGIEDQPDKILAAIRESDPGCDVLFKLSGVEQFRVNFCVYVRGADHELNNDGDRGLKW